MNLSNLNKITARKRKIIGRGPGSGKGSHTVGRGMKGQKSRTGYKAPSRAFEGGQNPLFRRLPKIRGFSRTSLQKDEIRFNLSDLSKLGLTTISKEILQENNLLPKSRQVKIKILGNGSIDHKIAIVGIPVSKTAQAKIEKKGGTVS